MLNRVDRSLPRRILPCAAAWLLALGASTAAFAQGPGPADERPAKLDFDPQAAPGSFAIIDGKAAPIPDIKLGDPAIVARIIDEGKNRNQVMDHLTHLTQKIGARLTGSSNLTAANRWSRDLFEQWGLQNAALWEWGTVATGFDRGVSTGVIYKAGEPRVANPRVRRRTGGGADDPPATPPSTQPSTPPATGTGTASDAKPADAATETPKPEPEPVRWTKVRDLEFTTLSWTRGTDGPVRGTVIKAPYTEAAYDAVKDRLKGAWVVIKPPAVRGMRDVRGRISTYYDQFRKAREQVESGEIEASKVDLPARLIFDGVAGFIMSSRDERVWTGSVRGWRELEIDKVDPETFVSVRLSDYDYINSRLADEEQIEVEFNLKNDFVKGPIPVYNTVAEIRGTTWPDQCVIISAHLDSWDGVGSQGATDNGTGSCVTLEAARILAAALKNAPESARPKRSIKFILWSGEEQGLLGSAAWVKAHPEMHDSISACFVDDGGTNFQGGLGAFPEQVPFLAAATAPINNVFFCPTDNAFLNVNIRHYKGSARSFGGGGSDHMSFNRVGIPGFFWDEEGRADYGFGWHTQNDKLNLAIPEYLMQSSTNAALVAYQLACADSLLPRAPKPEETKPSEETSPGAAKPEVPAPAGAGGSAGTGQ
ncbi:MAG: M28 family peptidase [Phycisphaerales bacterium]